MLSLSFVRRVIPLPYTAQILARFEDSTVFHFTPSYKCSLCPTVVTGNLCSYSVHTDSQCCLGHHQLTSSLYSKGGYYGSKIIGVDWADYYIFTICTSVTHFRVPMRLSNSWN